MNKKFKGRLKEQEEQEHEKTFTQTHSETHSPTFLLLLTGVQCGLSSVGAGLGLRALHQEDQGAHDASACGHVAGQEH